MSDLHRIGLKWKTDKATDHRYTEKFYPDHMDKIRNRELTVLEIGVLRGESICMWAEYFTNPKTRIFGVDIKIQKEAVEKTKSFPNVTLLEYNCEGYLFVDWLRKMGKDSFDIVIEDASHTMLQQQYLLKIVLPFVKPGGMYVLEDLHTSLSRREDVYRNGTPDESTTLQLIKHLTDIKNKYVPLLIKEVVLDRIRSAIDRISLFSVRDVSISAILYKRESH